MGRRITVRCDLCGTEVESPTALPIGWGTVQLAQFLGDDGTVQAPLPKVQRQVYEICTSCYGRADAFFQVGDNAKRGSH